MLPVSEEVEPQGSEARPLCMNQSARLFNHCRVPVEGSDLLINYGTQPAGLPTQHFATRFTGSNPRHIVVIAPSGRMFKADVVSEDGTRLSVPQLEDMFKTILALDAAERDGDGSSCDVPFLTAIDRDEWASHREALLGHSGANKAALEAVDAAMFVVALDGREVGDDQDALSRLILDGQGCRRWFDKHELVVTSDGRAGALLCCRRARACMCVHLTGAPSHCAWMCWLRCCLIVNVLVYAAGGAAGWNFEHAPGDGTTSLLMCESSYYASIGDAILSEASSDGLAAGEIVSPLTFELSQELTAACGDAKAFLNSFAGSMQSTTFRFRSFGKDRIKDMKVSPDGFAQMAMQYAYYLNQSKLVPTYESGAMRNYLHGRTETVRGGYFACLTCPAHVEMLDRDTQC